jgi:hypothetical protein
MLKYFCLQTREKKGGRKKVKKRKNKINVYYEFIRHCFVFWFRIIKEETQNFILWRYINWEDYRMEKINFHRTVENEKKMTKV